MKLEFRKLINNLFLMILIVVSSACGGGGNTPQEDTSLNAAPIVSAGGDFSVDESTQVGLEAQSSDSDGNIQSVEWTQISGISVSLENANNNSATFISPEVSQSEMLTFRVLVTDNNSATASDTVDLTVNDCAIGSELFSIGGQLTGA